MAAGIGKLRFALSHRFWWRLLWAVVLVCHAPVTIHALAVLQSGRGHTSIPLLAASNAFFILEILFAGSYRLLSSRRNLIAFALIVLMLHVGVLEQHGLVPASSSQLLYCLLLPTIGAVKWQTILQWAQRRLSLDHAPDPSRHARPAHRAKSNLNVLTPAQPQSAWHAAPLRAPPHFAL
jgi:hypothetical protein